MGKIFDLIEDEALKSSDESYECAFCGAKEVPIYEITGFQIEPRKYLFQSVPDDMQGTEKDEACENCIKSGKIKLFSEWEVENVLKEYCDSPEDELMRLRMTPSIPLFLQGYDWVACCGKLSEFMGTPKSYAESIDLVDTHQFWDKGPKNWKTFWSSEFTLEPESLDEVSKFRCNQCSKKWFIWQNT